MINTVSIIYILKFSVLQKHVKEDRKYTVTGSDEVLEYCCDDAGGMKSNHFIL